jgi:uncharacterized protein (DUF169 family)
MTDNKPWQEYGRVIKEVLQSAQNPVAITRLKECAAGNIPKVRICRAILDAGAGKSQIVHKVNNACIGASWHLGFHSGDDQAVNSQVRDFVVQGEKLYASRGALDTLFERMAPVPFEPEQYFSLAPLETAEQQPELVIFVANAEEACRLLALAMFADGIMPRLQIGGPTCRMAVMHPLITGEVNISFFDYTARKLCAVEKDKLLVAIPYSKIPSLINSLDTCSAGRARLEYSREFRALLRKRHHS